MTRSIVELITAAAFLYVAYVGVIMLLGWRAIDTTNRKP